MCHSDFSSLYLVINVLTWGEDKMNVNIAVKDEIYSENGV